MQTTPTLPEGLPTSESPQKPSLMQAIVHDRYGSADVLRLETVAHPTIAQDEVLIEVHAAGVDRGTEHLMTGRPYLVRLSGYGITKPKNPIPGLDVAGVVVEVGSAVTALHALVDVGRVERGQRVLVLGASGGVGTYAVQLAKALGAEVTGVASTSKLEMVRSLGVDHVIDHTTSDFADGRHEYDLILDIGGRSGIARLRRALSKNGTLVIVGGEDGNRFTGGVGRQLRAVALSPFVSQRLTMFIASVHHSFIERLVHFIDHGQITPVIGQRFELAGVPEAMRQLAAGRATGKTVIRVKP